MDIRILGRTDYRATVQAMQDFTAERTDSTPDAACIVHRKSRSRPPIWPFSLQAWG